MQFATSVGQRKNLSPRRQWKQDMTFRTLVGVLPT